MSDIEHNDGHSAKNEHESGHSADDFGDAHEEQGHSAKRVKGHSADKKYPRRANSDDSSDESYDDNFKRSNKKRAKVIRSDASEDGEIPTDTDEKLELPKAHAQVCHEIF